MLSSEKKSLIRFLSIYMVSTLTLFSILSYIYYNANKKDIIDRELSDIMIKADSLTYKIIELHKSQDKILYYPNPKEYKSAIFDLDKNYIFGSLKLDNLNNLQKDKNKIYYIKKLKPYYLGAAYLLIEKPIDKSSIDKLKKDLILFFIGAFILFSILAYFLGKIFIKPMKSYVEQLNSFIQDTTHELNTPISTILNNIELIESFGECKKNQEELDRIKIASLTLNHIYDDLTYLKLNNKYYRKVEKIDVAKLLQERLKYFSLMFKSKNLRVESLVNNCILNIDRGDIIRVIDNLISNAIKYNKFGSKIEIILNKDKFIVKDEGIGIKEDELKNITKRFKRANKSEGGFGIGLSVVDNIIKYYGYSMSIESKENLYTKVTIKW